MKTLTRVQRVPAEELGVDVEWSRGLGRHQTLVAGAEAYEFRGESDELVVATKTMVDAGGRQHNVGIFGEDIIHRVTLSQLVI